MGLQQYLGTGNGVQTSFPMPNNSALVLLGADATLVPYQTDALGTVPLRNSARTNYVLYSENNTYFGANTGTPTIAATTIADLDSGTTDSAYLNTTIPNDSNTLLASCFIATGSGVICGLRSTLSGGTPPNSVYLMVNTATGAFKCYDSTNAPVAGGSVTPVAGGFVCSWPITNNSTGNTTLLIICYPAYAGSLGSPGAYPVVADATQTQTVTIGKWQIVEESVRGAYYYTNGSTVTRTDYSLSGSNVVFAVATANGVTLTWNGQTLDRGN